MKTAIIATVILVLAVPAFAAKWPPSTAVRQDIFDFEWSYGVCVYRKQDDPNNIGNIEEIKKACVDAGKLRKKLTAQGYCIYGKGTVGLPSKDGKHCHEGIDNRIRHDRMCDMVQEKFDLFRRVYSPGGGSAVMFGTCYQPIKDLPNGEMSRRHFWLAVGCGYQAYREGKQLKDNPYKNDELKDTWKNGWNYARKSCATGRLPVFNPEDDDNK